MNAVCVFTGSSPGAKAEYREVAMRLGSELVARELALVYGGAHVGLMGAVADAVLEAGGRAIGVIPEFLVAKEVAHEGLSELHVVETMHERKAKMAALASGFIALPGGVGTFEETFEILSWAQLGMHEKPCGLLNVSGYYDGLISFLDHAVSERFVKPVHRELVLVAEEPDELLDAFRVYSPPDIDKWLDREHS
ncbi:MAG: TIGR00730 family Rossman fold protein [bacterium]|nr:TIGR00730 family Rossman fold protein [bacterium]MCP5045215.1 TIGR00730 family Rossman fold protein [bacterium]